MNKIKELITNFSGKTFSETKDAYEYLEKEIEDLLAEQKKELEKQHLMAISKRAGQEFYEEWKNDLIKKIEDLRWSIACCGESSDCGAKKSNEMLDEAIKIIKQ